MQVDCFIISVAKSLSLTGSVWVGYLEVFGPNSVVNYFVCNCSL